MSDRDRLIELIDGFVFGTQIAVNNIEWDSTKVKELADYLIANGIIMLPCKVGDTIYFDTYKRGESIGIQPHKVANISIVVSTERPFGCVGADIYDWEFGKTVFLSREEAERRSKGEEK